MDTEKQQTIDKHIQKLGFEDIYTYALEQLILSNERQLEESKQTIASFEEKYGMTYDGFDSNFHSITHIDLFEREDDGMDWEMELHFIEVIERELTMLRVF